MYGGYEATAFLIVFKSTVSSVGFSKIAIGERAVALCIVAWSVYAVQKITGIPSFIISVNVFNISVLLTIVNIFNGNKNTGFFNSSKVFINRSAKSSH